MTDLNKIAAGAKLIEHVLTKEFGGSGLGMRHKLDSARYPIPQPLQETIRYLARERNRCMHELDHEGIDGDEYLRKCEAVCAELQKVLVGARRVAQETAARQQAARQAAAQQQAAREAALEPLRQQRAAERLRKWRRQRLMWRLGFGTLLVAGAWWLLRPAPADVADAASTQAAATGAQPAPAAAPGRHGKKREAGAGKGEKPAAGASHIGIGNDVLALESIEFAYRKGSFDDLEPRMMVTVRNVSDRTIGLARLDGRMYLGDEAHPAVDTSSGGMRNDPLYLFFGDNGLAPGARRKEQVYLSRDDRWMLPDLINASRRKLVLRVKEVQDGRKQAFGGEAPAWPAVQAAGSAAAPRPAVPSLGVEEYRRRFAAGEHVVLSDSRLDIDKLEVRLQDDFGSRKPAIRARFTNRSGVTLSSATFRVQLFIKGETTPVADSKGGFSSDNVYAFFDRKGLADGAGVMDDFSALRRGNWDAPDVINAIRTGRAQLVVRLESLSDGRKQDLPSKATDIRDL